MKYILKKCVFYDHITVNFYDNLWVITYRFACLWYKEYIFLILLIFIQDLYMVLLLDGIFFLNKHASAQRNR